MFCIYLRTKSDLCHLQHKLIGFYNRDEKSLLRGTDWVFKYSSLRFVFKRLNDTVVWSCRVSFRLKKGKKGTQTYIISMSPCPAVYVFCYYFRQNYSSVSIFFYSWAAPSTVDVKPPLQWIIGSLVEFKPTWAWRYLLTHNPKDMKNCVELYVRSAIRFNCLAHKQTAKFNCLRSPVLHFNDRTY